MTAAKDERNEAARLAADGAEKFREADARERESRGAPTEERLRVLEETIDEERQAIEDCGEAIELRRQAAGEAEATKE